MLNIPFFGKEAKQKQWADSGVTENQEPQSNPFKQALAPFAKKFPKVRDHVKLTKVQLDSITPSLGMTYAGPNELALALSRIDADTHYAALPAAIKEVIEAWRLENAENGDESAKRELLSGNEVLAEMDAKHLAAKQAQAEADSFESEVNAAWASFSALPDKASKVNAKLARLQGERQYLQSMDYDASIKALYLHLLDPAPNTTMGGNLHELCAQKALRDVKLTILAELEVKFQAELEVLREQNRTLSSKLGKPDHNI
jgi:hypothetical protein